MADKKKKSIKQKIKDFVNRKTKQSRDKEVDLIEEVEDKKILRHKRVGPDGKPGILWMNKGGPVHIMPDGTIMKGAKHGMEAGGYVLSADEKRRRKEFKGASAVKSNVGKKMKKMKHGGIVDRQYLKGK